MEEITTQQKALIVIEYIAIHADDEDKNMGVVYKLSHVANGNCTANHEDWAKLLEDIFDDLVKSGEYNPDPRAPVCFEELASEIRKQLDRTICQTCGKKLVNSRCANDVCPKYAAEV